jgi:hypothetical protein
METLVGLTQFFECRFEEGLVLDSLAGTQGCQPVQAHINADSGWSLHWDDIRDFYLDGYKPPVRRFGDACTCYLAGEAQIFCHIHPSQFGDPDAMIAQLALIVGKTRSSVCFASCF